MCCGIPETLSVESSGIFDGLNLIWQLDLRVRMLWDPRLYAENERK
jgi:hypothetical protein